METAAEALLKVWFGEDLDTPEALAEHSALWFSSNPSFDEQLREQFEALPDRALAGGLAEWTETPRPTLALVLALDQLPRNLYRGSARAFAYDAAGLATARAALARGVDRELHPVQAAFLYLPFEHAEDAACQAQCVELFRKLAERAPAHLRERIEGFGAFAERHRTIIERFGRFPHRNAVLGRPSTPEERDYLESGGETFSGGEGAAQRAGMKPLPPGAVAYQRSQEFSEATIPAGLTRRHTTKPGVWARICVVEGSLRYRILEPALEEHVLSPGSPGVVEPETPHEIEALGEVRFFVEFLRSPG